MTNWIMGWRLARRELRGGVRGLRIVLACLALGLVGGLAQQLPSGAQDTIEHNSLQSLEIFRT